MKQKYYTLNELIDMIEEPNRTACYNMMKDNKKRFEIARGSSKNHQAWEGGYLDHLTETMNLAVMFYKQINELRPLLFPLSDVLLALYLHDLEKPWRYEKNKKGEWEINTELADKGKTALSFVEKKIKEYKFNLSEEQWNGIKYAEGEKSDYSPEQRISTPLAAFVHMCDSWSARGWYNYPKKDNDSWTGAKRSYKNN